MNVMDEDSDRRELLTMAEVAAMLRIELNTLRQWRIGGGGGPPGFRIGKRVLFRRSDVDEWIASKFEPPVAAPTFAPPDGAVAAPRYFPWALIAETVAEEVCIALEANSAQCKVIRNGVFAALPAAYDTYSAAIREGGDHDTAERSALDRLRGALVDNLRAVERAREVTTRAEAG